MNQCNPANIYMLPKTKTNTVQNKIDNKVYRVLKTTAETMINIKSTV